MQNQEAREKLKEHLDKTGRKNAFVARAIGLSGPVVSSWIHGNYQGDNERVSQLILTYLEREREKAASPKLVLTFTHTSASRKMFEVASICRAEGEIGVVVSDAGIGKTQAVKRYAKEHPETILIEVDPGVTAKSLVGQIAKALGMEPKGMINGLLDRLFERLNESGRLLIIDEAESLPYRALEIVRRLHDRTGIGVLLTGLPRLFENLRGRAGEFAQLYSRVGVHVKLECVTEKDTEAVLKNTLPGINGLSKAYHDITLGRMRMLEKLVRRSVKLADIRGEELNEAIIQDAREYLIYY